MKAVAHLEPLTADTGALRLLPGSHRLDERVLSRVLHGPAFRSEDSWRPAIRQVPCHVIETMPGDVIVFDEHLWHASSGGRHRHQWAAEFVLDPASPEEELAVGAYLASQFSPDHSLDYDPIHTPTMGQPSAQRGRRGGSRSWTGWAARPQPTSNSADHRRQCHRKYDDLRVATSAVTPAPPAGSLPSLHAYIKLRFLVVDRPGLPIHDRSAGGLTSVGALLGCL